MSSYISFNKPYVSGNEINYISQVLSGAMQSGDGPFTKRCHEWFVSKLSCRNALLTNSCTTSLEMAALLCDIQPGDEIIMPSYTFVSTANAFVLRGGVPVFVDIREDTLNLDEGLVEEAVTPRTRVIVPVHYAGVACEMESIMDIAKRKNLKVVEDAAQGIMATYKGKALGTIGDLGCYSFHETKNISCGEGGALLVNNPALVTSAEIIWEKGTDRRTFVKGLIDKYTWQDLGSSFLPSEVTAAYLLAQLEIANYITQQRLSIWQLYHDLLQPLEQIGLLRRPIVPPECKHNAHMYYVILAPGINKQKVLAELIRNNIVSTSYYVPLHSSPGGHKYARMQGQLNNTVNHSNRLVRLPIWVGLSVDQQKFIVEVLRNTIN